MASFVYNRAMKSTEKVQMIDDFLLRLKNGEDESIIMAEYEECFGKISLPSHKKKNEGNYLAEENPLLLLAEENGALRALNKNIRFDFQTQDDFSASLLENEIKRLDQIKYHFEKIGKVLLPFLDDETKKKEILSSERDILQKKTNLEKEGRLFENKNGWLSLLDEIEENIVYENHFLLPLMEDRLDPFQLKVIWVSFLNYKTCLIDPVSF